MNWNKEEERLVARSEQPSGYRISWSLGTDNKYFFNAYFEGHPPLKHLAGSYDREVCKSACEKHAAMNLSLPVDPATTQR